MLADVLERQLSDFVVIGRGCLCICTSVCLCAHNNGHVDGLRMFIQSIAMETLRLPLECHSCWLPSRSRSEGQSGEFGQGCGSVWGHVGPGCGSSWCHIGTSWRSFTPVPTPGIVSKSSCVKVGYWMESLRLMQLSSRLSDPTYLKRPPSSDWRNPNLPSSFPFCDFKFFLCHVTELFITLGRYITQLSLC